MKQGETRGVMGAHLSPAYGPVFPYRYTCDARRTNVIMRAFHEHGTHEQRVPGTLARAVALVEGRPEGGGL